MPINEWLLPEFDQEMATTRKVLARVADNTLGWKPHEKSWTMGALATHVARIPTWAGITIHQDNLDLAAPGPSQPAVTSNAELLALFEENIEGARKAIEGASDETLFQPWSLLNSSATLLTLPKVAVLRSFVMNHLIHHRGQLSVYLRLNDIPVPSIYGPSADEAGF
jgi:uncharacterized damage-inducible protein DinB